MTNDTEPVPTIDDVLRNFARRVEQIPRGKTYGWSEEKRQIERICASERQAGLKRAMKLLDGTGVWDSKTREELWSLIAEAEPQLEGETK